MEITVDNEFVKPYFEGRKKGRNYALMLDQYYHVSFHFDGYFIHVPSQSERLLDRDIDKDAFNIDRDNPYFKRLIDLKRPSESDEIKTYRRTIYEPFTKRPLFKVYNSLRKIVKSPDWNISYTDTKIPAKIADNETLEKYCEDNFPHFDSVENWIYNFGIRAMLNDANALICVLPMPKKNPDDATEFYKPIPYIYSSKDVLDYVDDEYVVFVKTRKASYGKDNKKGLILGIVTKQGYYEARQVDDKKTFVIDQIYKYDFEYLNAWRLGGLVRKPSDTDTLYESFLSPMLPDLDEMARDCSEFQAEKVQHIFNTMWYIAQQDCKQCNGTGKVKGKGNQVITCTMCLGSGIPAKSPYKDIVIKQGALDQGNIPTPPAGYLEKDVKIIEQLRKILEDDEYNALSAVNHEFLAEAPLNQSGKAKSIDRQEIQNFTYQVAYHVVEHILEDVYYFVNEFRYSELIPDSEERKKQLPSISIPENFDFIDAALQSQYMKEAIENKMDATILQSMEMDYAAKNFPNNHELKDHLKLKNVLDPLPKLTPEEKSLMVGKSITMEDVVISNYITSFIKRAIKEDKKFPDIDYDKQIEKMQQYAQEKMDTMNKAATDKIKQQQKLFANTDGQKAPSDGKVNNIDPVTGKPNLSHSIRKLHKINEGRF